MTTPYTTGSITLANGSAVVIGVGTAWQTALIAGGTIYVEADGNPLPILTVDGNTQITAAIKWKGASGTYPYAIMRDTAYGQQTVANAQALSTYLQRLDSASLSALASLAASMSADKFAYTTGLNSMAWAALSAFGREMLALGDAAAVRSKIGAFGAGGGTIGGPVTVNSTIRASSTIFAPYMALDTDGSNEGSLSFQTNGLNRFNVFKSLSGGETGSNNGSNLAVNRWSDAGSYLGTPLIIQRSTGIVTLNETPYMQCNMGPDFSAVAGQQYGVANFGFDLQRGGFTIGGNVGGRSAVHVPVAGRYRIMMTVSGSAASAPGATLEFMVNGSAVSAHLAYSTAFNNMTNIFLINVSAGSYFTVRPTGSNLNISGWNSRVQAEFISF